MAGTRKEGPGYELESHAWIYYMFSYINMCLLSCVSYALSELTWSVTIVLIFFSPPFLLKCVACTRHRPRRRYLSSLNVAAVPAGHQQRLIKVTADLVSCGAHSDTVLNTLR